MGETLSTPSQSNRCSNASTPTMASPNSSSDTHQSKSEAESQIPDPPKTAEEKSRSFEDSVKEAGGDEEGEEEEEEGECGFCLFMKGGGCKETFTEWEKCVEDGEKNKEDIVEKCFQATANLKKCMEAHSDYYAPLLQAEKAAEEEAVKQLEEEKEKERLNNQQKEKEKEKEEPLDDSQKKEES